MTPIQPETKPLNSRSRAASLGNAYAKFQAAQNAETSKGAIKANVVIIDSENSARESLKQFLEIEGYSVHPYKSVADFENNSSLKEYDVILIDVNFSDENLLFWLKNQKLVYGRGIVIISFQNDPISKLTARKNGADDYLIKPVLLEEASLVINNLLSRINQKLDEDWVLLAREWILISPKGQRVKLTYNEKTILQTLAQAPGEVISKEVIAEHLGYPANLYDYRRLEIIIRRLRNKVEQDIGMRLPLETANRKGYSFISRINVQTN
jgi:DNA-binding response OmpR family regulator